MQRLSLTEMVHGYEALAEQAAQKNLPYCDFLEQVPVGPFLSIKKATLCDWQASAMGLVRYHLCMIIRVGAASCHRDRREFGL